MYKLNLFLDQLDFGNHFVVVGLEGARTNFPWQIVFLGDHLTFFVFNEDLYDSIFLEHDAIVG